MKTAESFSITVPGSTANLGPGFDSVGLAINRYLKLHVEESEYWHFDSKSESLKDVEMGEENLIFKVCQNVLKNVGKSSLRYNIQVSSSIPLARGLGSSATAIVAGIELANCIGQLNLTTEEKLLHALKWENHLDNIAASLFGGLVISSFIDGNPYVIKQKVSEIDIIAIIPSYTLSTSEARKVLPKVMSYHDAVKASSHANILVASLLSGNWEGACKAMKEDLFHQKHRKHLIREWEELQQFVDSDDNIYGMSLSGAGPTILFFIKKDFGQVVNKKLLDHGFYTEFIQVEQEGSKVIYNS